MVLKLYGAAPSTTTLLVAAVCKELNVPYEFVPVSMMDYEHKGPEFLQKNPFGQVPAIEDDGTVLFESRAICRYLAAKYGSPLLPSVSDLQNYAKFEVASSIESATFGPPSSQLIFEKCIKVNYLQMTPDENLVNELVKTLNEKLAVYETILSKHKYLAGDKITLADLFHLPNGHTMETIKYDLLNVESRPNVARWWKDISSRPSWESVKSGP